VHLPGTEAGLLWVQVSETEDDSTHRAYLHLSAELMRRSPVVLRTVRGVDSAALWNRLNDAATVAGRTAHDFDNVLTGVIGFAELSQAQVEPGSPLGIYLAEIAKAGQRGQDFTRQLHQFNRVGQSRTRPGSLQPVLEQELHKCRQRCGDRIRIEQTIPAELPMITLGELASAIVVRNLLDNAVESMPNGGTITVQVRRQTVTPEDRDRYLGHLAAGPCLEVVIADTGSGITPAFRDKVFTQPLTTSKHRHRGLGLATVFRILYRHDAGIRIEPRSAPETGTIVRLLFPLAHRPGEASA
jgi:signal transduction histidine kinase